MSGSLDVACVEVTAFIATPFTYGRIVPPVYVMHRCAHVSFIVNVSFIPTDVTPDAVPTHWGQLFHTWNLVNHIPKKWLYSDWGPLIRYPQSAVSKLVALHITLIV